MRSSASVTLVFMQTVFITLSIICSYSPLISAGSLASIHLRTRFSVIYVTVDAFTHSAAKNIWRFLSCIDTFKQFGIALNPAFLFVFYFFKVKHYVNRRNTAKCLVDTPGKRGSSKVVMTFCLTTKWDIPGTDFALLTATHTELPFSGLITTKQVAILSTSLWKKSKRYNSDNSSLCRETYVRDARGATELRV